MIDKEKKRIIVVLGMHRSGTSAVARGLQVMGIDLGNNLMPAVESINAKGFWEDLDIYALNNELLGSVGSNWHYLVPLESSDVEALHKRGYFAKAAALLDRKLEEKNVFGFKDPRVAKLLPFWKEVFIHCQFSASYVLVIRHPLSVVKSLAKRDSFDAEKSYFLWLGHIIESMTSSAGSLRVLVDYDKLMQSPEIQINRIAERLRLEVSAVELNSYASKFLDKTLQHTVYDLNDLSLDESCPLLVREIYATLLDAASDNISLDDSRLRNRLEQWANEWQRLKPILALVDRLSTPNLMAAHSSSEDFGHITNPSQILAECERQIAGFEEALNERDARIANLDEALVERTNQITSSNKAYSEIHARLTAIENSTTWKMTLPLRRVVGKLKLGLKRNSEKSAAGSTDNALVKRFLSNSRIRSWYASFRNLSTRIIYPLAPKLYELVFIRLNQYLKRRYFGGNSAGPSIFSRKDIYFSPGSISIDFAPKVSVIVPSYNHANFLHQRLDSIFGQTYKNMEVILLDDASKDGSQEILEEYRRRYPGITRSAFNETNTGKVFNQWQRGFEMAAGDLIWIAESDDYCSEDFLTEIVKYFMNEAVMLAYCRTIFVERESAKQVWTLEEYLNDLGMDSWRDSFVASANYLVNKAWAIKNVVPNVSSAVFRHPGKLALLDDESWKQMKICGDWIFYLHVVRGGLVAYTSRATNYYRLHENNTSRNTYSTDTYFQEHELVAKELLALYRLNSDLLERQKSALQSQWCSFRTDYSENSFKQCYDYKRIQYLASDRKPNLLMVSFALIAGGGETFPIKLANMLKAAGYSVTFLNCHRAPTESGVRQMLRKDIPLLELSTFETLSAIVDDMGIEIVHSHHGWVDANICHFLDPGSSTELVVTTHGMYETIPQVELAQVLPLLKRRVSKFVYLADKNLAPFRSNHFDMDRFVRIDNAVDICPINPVSRFALGVPSDAFLICLVSRAIPEKGWQEGIEAVGLARKTSGKDIHLLLIGAGPEHDRLRAIVQDEFIHFLGFRPNTRDYFATSDLGFLPSRFLGESFPLVLIECLHSNRPMLASNVGEIKKMLSTDSGPAGTVFDLENGNIPIAAVAKMIATYAEKRSAYLDQLQHVPTAAAKFDPAIMLKSYEKVYLELLKGKSTALVNKEEVKKCGVLEAGV